MKIGRIESAISDHNMKYKNITIMFYKYFGFGINFESEMTEQIE